MKVKPGVKVLLNTSIDYADKNFDQFSWNLMPKTVFVPAPMRDIVLEPFLESLTLARMFEKIYTQAKYPEYSKVQFTNYGKETALIWAALLRASRKIEQILITQGIEFPGPNCEAWELMYSQGITLNEPWFDPNIAEVAHDFVQEVRQISSEWSAK